MATATIGQPDASAQEIVPLPESDEPSEVQPPVKMTTAEYSAYIQELLGDAKGFLERQRIMKKGYRTAIEEGWIDP